MTREDNVRRLRAGRHVLTAESAAFVVRALAHAAELQALFPAGRESYERVRRCFLAARNSQRRAWAIEDAACE